MLREKKTFEFNQRLISVDDFIEFREKGETGFKRGIVSYVDKNSIKIVRRYHDQISISAHMLGHGDYEVHKLEVR